MTADLEGLACADAMTWGIRDFVALLNEAVRLRLAAPATRTAPTTAWRHPALAAAAHPRQGRTG
ncbi:MAG: hypothetical protein JF597_02540 [Streptomyces sp.]|uniref:hypothetical protein n=1 Tax=Streptomyces sp. TaxID=1931 RepID=UPI0025D9CBD1|nr:hypothetical protein [Streptomyces sp.]MBW8792499.1 hypothetical protein [Streptomyces sp.]